MTCDPRSDLSPKEDLIFPEPALKPDWPASQQHKERDMAVNRK